MIINWKFLLKGMGAYITLPAVVVFAVVLRDAIFLPAFGPMAAQWLGAAVSLVFLFGLTALLLRMIREPRRLSDLVALGLVWAIVTAAIEFYVVYIFFQAPLEEWLASYRFWQGQAWVIILIGLAAAPPLTGRRP